MSEEEKVEDQAPADGGDEEAELPGGEDAEDEALEEE